MPVPSTINDLSTTAALNFPAGTDSPSQLDDVQRAHASFIAQLRDEVAAGSAGLSASSGASLVGYLPAGTGAVATAVQAKLRESVSVKDFGAVGDGITDDTAAIQAALNSNILRVILTDGNYKITQKLVSLLSDRRIISDGGVLFCDTQEMIALEVGGNSSIVSVNIDGNNKARQGVSVIESASDYVVKNCNISNIRSTSAAAFGIVSLSGLGGIIEDNTIDNVFSVGNAPTTGDANGLSRGIQYLPSVTPTAPTTIKGNTLTGIMGQEGDAVSVQIGNSAPFPKSLCIVSENVITNFSRRAVKVQGAGTHVTGNVILSVGQASEDLLPANAISVVASDSCNVYGNRMSLDSKFPIGINIDGSDAVISNGGSVSNNYIENPSAVGVQLRQVVGAVADSNYVKGTDIVGVEVQVESSRCVVNGNVLNIEHSGTAVVYIGATAPNTVVTNNVSVGASGYRFIRVLQTGCVIQNNHNAGTVFSNSLISGPGTSSAANARGTCISGNTTSGDELILANLNGGETFISGNFKRQGSGDSGITANQLWAIANPATATPNLYYDRGSIAWNKNATVGQPIGWLCTVGGKPGTWVGLQNL